MKSLILTLVFLVSAKAFAIEYYELEVYGAQTASQHELEIENTTSFSSDQQNHLSDAITRSTFEFNYGFSDRWEGTAYFDYTKPSDDTAEFTSFRTHVRTYFYEKGEMPVDLGVYFEAELPRNFRAKDVGLEFRPIIEKDFSRWTLRLNPTVELSHIAKTEGENSVAVDPDGDVVNSTTTQMTAQKYWMATWSNATSVIYHYSDHMQPHLDWHVGLTDGSSLVMPGLNMKLAKGINADLGLAFGLNNKTESRLMVARLEFESFL